MVTGAAHAAKQETESEEELKSAKRRIEMLQIGMNAKEKKMNENLSEQLFSYEKLHLRSLFGCAALNRARCTRSAVQQFSTTADTNRSTGNTKCALPQYQ